MTIPYCAQNVLRAVDERLCAPEPFSRYGLYFPAIAKAIQSQNRSEFGADADRPD